MNTSGSSKGGPAPATTTGPVAPDEPGAEHDAAASAPGQGGRRRRARRRARGVLAVVLVVLFAILLPVTILSTWAHRTVTNTDAYVATLGPIAASPVVRAAVSTQITNEIYAALNPRQTIAAALPPKAAKLAGPISAGVRGYLQDAVNKVLAKPKFEQLWVAANRFAHTQLIAALKGDTKTLQTTNGHVVLNLVPLLNEALKQVQSEASGLFGKNITLPAVTSSGIPAADCAKISAAIGRPLSPNCGQIALFPASALTGAQRGYRAFNGIVLLLLIVTPLVFIAALWASPRRRRTLLQLTIGGMLALIVVRRAMYWLESDLVAAAKPENRAALSVIVGQVLHGLFDATLWFLIGGLILLVVVLLAGPYRWAVATRAWGRSAARSAGQLASATGGHATSDGTVAWVRRHLDLLRIAGIVLAALALLIFSINWVILLVIAVLLALYEFGLHRLRQPQPAT
jgi:hypothetical protein